MDKWFISLSPLTGVPLIPQSELVAHPLQFNPITLAAFSKFKKRATMSVYGREKESVPITAKLLSTINISAKTEREREKKRKTRRLHAVFVDAEQQNI